MGHKYMKDSEQTHPIFQIKSIALFGGQTGLLELPLRSAIFARVWQALPSLLTCPESHQPAL